MENREIKELFLQADKQIAIQESKKTTGTYFYDHGAKTAKNSGIKSKRNFIQSVFIYG